MLFLLFFFCSALALVHPCKEVHKCNILEDTALLTPQLISDLKDTLDKGKKFLNAIDYSLHEFVLDLEIKLRVVSRLVEHGATPSDTCDYERMCEARVTAAIASTTASCNLSTASDMTIVIPPPPQQPIMSFAVEPAALVFPAVGGNSTLTLTNSGDDKIMYKIKSSNNKKYIIKPTHGFIDGKAAAHVQITRLPGSTKEDKLTIQFAPAPEGAADAQEAFKSASLTGEVTIPCKATEFESTASVEARCSTPATTESTTKTSTTTTTSKAPTTTEDPRIAEGIYCLNAVCRGYFNAIKNKNTWSMIWAPHCDSNSHWRIIRVGKKIHILHILSQEFLGIENDHGLRISKNGKNEEWTPIKNDDGSWTFQSTLGSKLAAIGPTATMYTPNDHCQHFNLERVGS